MGYIKGLRGLMKGALQLVYPPQCMGCGDHVHDDGGLCPDCWRETDFIAGPICNDCGAPVPGLGEADAALSGDHIRCDDCLNMTRPWVQARAAVTYRGTGRKLALMLKHGDRLDLAPHLGDWLARAAAPLVQADTIVIAMPLHLRRLLKRKYNQASLLSDRVARAHGLDHWPDILVRNRNSPPQDHRSFDERFANQHGAFTLPARHRDKVKNRPILLIDDVMASGASLSAAAACLNAHEVGAISVAVLARAVKDP